jgi:hypothetical protein
MPGKCGLIQWGMEQVGHGFRPREAGFGVLGYLMLPEPNGFTLFVPRTTPALRYPGGCPLPS